MSLAAEEAGETLLPLAEERGVAIETSGDLAPTAGSPALLLQLTTNLVHNAIVHNVPERGTVWITTGVDGAAVVLAVENTGETLSPTLVSTLAEPFHRGAERRHASHAGVGLGLAIVERMVQTHDGTMTLAPRPAGGLRVTVQLPADPCTRPPVDDARTTAREGPAGPSADPTVVSPVPFPPAPTDSPRSTESGRNVLSAG